MSGAVLALVIFTAGGTAFATGGLFPMAPAPNEVIAVDVAAERIVFELEPGVVTAHVQLRYLGAPGQFAWIIPVPAVPEVSEGSAAFMQALDDASSLEVKMPPSDPCKAPAEIPMDDAAGCGCGGSNALPVPSDPRRVGGPMSTHPPVTLYGSSYTENYEYVVVGDADVETLVSWLRDHGYAAPDNMRPVMAAYARPGMKFLALRLREDRAAADVAPIRIRYAADRPVIPLELASVAAQPFTAVLVLILADQTYFPEDFVAVPPRSGEILFDGEHRTSYFDWVARAVDETNGRLFVTEYLGDAPLSGNVGGVEIRGRYLSRYYTRISPENMTADPSFRPHPNPDLRVDNMLNLTAEDSLFRCEQLQEERVPNACGFNYCGKNAQCAVLDGEAACLCTGGEVARPLMAPDGARRVVCVPRENPYAVPASMTGAGTDHDPCRNAACGQGACVLSAGTPTCLCASGSVARLTPDGVECVTAPPGLPTFGRGAGPESKPVRITAARRDLGAAYAGGIWAMIAFALWRRRTQRGA